MRDLGVRNVCNHCLLERMRRALPEGHRIELMELTSGPLKGWLQPIEIDAKGELAREPQRLYFFEVADHCTCKEEAWRAARRT